MYCFDGQTILSTVYGNGDVVICQAYCNIKVGVPSSPILNVQSEQLNVGRDMPIYPSFPEARIRNQKECLYWFSLLLLEF